MYLNTEIAINVIKNKQDCLMYLKNTYFFKRIFKNPQFYGLKNDKKETI